MKYKYKKEHEITYSEVDKDVKLGVVNSMNLAQDMMTTYFKTIGSDNYTVKKNDNAAWVVAKNNIHFYRRPYWLEKLRVSSNITLIKKIRLGLETVFKNENDEVQFIVSQEICPIDLDTRKVKKIETISFPDDMEAEEPTIIESFSKLNTEFGDKDMVYKYTIRATDIDFSNHTNNVSYIRLIMNSIQSDYWDDKDIINFEIHFINESKENEKLFIYKNELQNNQIEFLITNEEKEVVRAKIDYSKIY